MQVAGYLAANYLRQNGVGRAFPPLNILPPPLAAALVVCRHDTKYEGDLTLQDASSGRTWEVHTR